MDNGLVTVRPMLDRVADWQSYLSVEESDSVNQSIRLHSRTGRPQGNASFVDEVRSLLQRDLRAKKPGPQKDGCRTTETIES